MIVDPAIEAYLHRWQPSPDPILKAMEKAASERHFPIIGPLVGRLCEQMARLMGAKHIFEMGSGFGYSTYWFARGLAEGGKVIHTDWDPQKSEEARTWLRRGGLEDRVVFETGEACALLERFDGPFDIIFIDIDKEAYPRALELARPRVRKGGLIIADNILWSGKVLHPEDEATRGILAYTRQVFTASELLTTLIPLRDGVALSLKL